MTLMRMFLLILALELILLGSSTAGPFIPLRSDGGNYPPSFLIVSPYTDKVDVYRNDSIMVGYNITSRFIDQIKIKIPKEIEDVSISLGNNLAKFSSENSVNCFVIKLGGSNKNRSINFAYRGKISMNALGDKHYKVISLDKMIDSCSYKVALPARIVPQNITINNKGPIAIFNILRSSDISALDSKIFNGENITISLVGEDLENDPINYELYDGMNLSCRGNLSAVNDYKKNITYNVHKHAYLKAILSDNHGGYSQKIEELTVMDCTVNQYVSYFYGLILIALSIFFSLALYFRRAFRKRRWFCIILSMWSTITLLIFGTNNFILFHPIFNLKIVPFYELSLYVLALAYSAYFIESNFSTSSEPLEIHSSEYDIYPQHADLEYLEGGNAVSKFFINAFISVRHKFSRQPDFGLWLMTTASMTVIMVLLIIFIPNTDIFNSSLSEQSDRYNYIFWYYSMITQMFGSILAIVVAFTTWYLNEKNLYQWQRDGYKHKIKNFIILYTSIILLSVVGLVVGTIPPIDNLFGTLSTIPDAVSILTLELTLLLIAPAFACLYELARWTMELKN